MNQVKVKGEAVSMPCDQWCEVIETEGMIVRVRLLGTGDKVAITTKNIIGVRLSKSLSIEFEVSLTRFSEAK